MVSIDLPSVTRTERSWQLRCRKSAISRQQQQVNPVVFNYDKYTRNFLAAASGYSPQTPFLAGQEASMRFVCISFAFVCLLTPALGQQKPKGPQQ
jgi:hypothetical protein